jgi:hypothetical protein
MSESTSEDEIRDSMGLPRKDKAKPSGNPDRRSLKEKLSDYTFVPSPDREEQALVERIDAIPSVEEMVTDLQAPTENDLRREMNLPAKREPSPSDSSHETVEDTERQRMHLPRRKEKSSP